MCRPSFFAVASLVLLAACRTAAPPQPQPQDPGAGSAPEYAVRLRVVPEERLVEASAELRGLDGPLTLTLAERYAYVTPEPRLVGDVRAFAGGKALDLERIGPFRWRLDPDADGRARLAWTMRLDHRDDPEVAAATDGFEHPFVDERSGLLATAAIVLFPEVERLDTRLTLFLPTGWDAIAPWPRVAAGGTDAFGTASYAPDREGLRNDLIAIGAWDRVDGETDGLRYTIAFSPGQDGVKALATKCIPPIVEAEIELFGGAPKPAYLFLFGPPGPGRAYGGSPKANSMTMFVSGEVSDPTIREGVPHLAAHEYHHTWMRSRCEPEDELRYVAEGFTDYYAYVVLWRTGMITDARYLEILEEKLGAAESSLARFGRSLESSGGPAFFAGGDAHAACYAGGLGLALWTDLALRRASGGEETLDALMRAFYGDPRWDGGARPAAADLHALLAERGSDAIARAHADAASSADGIDWVSLLRSVDAGVQRLEQPIPGGPRANYEGTVITTLDPAGAGAATGLRAGDRVLEVNGQPVTSGAEVRAAWSEVEGDTLAVRWERDGKAMAFAAPPPTAATYVLDGECLEQLR